jgi:GNAT superfamily N-acetyltransferase
MLDAYRGTIDERHKTVAEAAEHIAKYFNGDFGKPLPDCSYMAIDAGRPVSVTLVSLDCDEPLLAQAYTAPAWQCRGLASALIQMSMNSLAAGGFRALNLVVTAGNTPAERVYRKLGFEPFDQAEQLSQQQAEVISP